MEDGSFVSYAPGLNRGHPQFEGSRKPPQDIPAEQSVLGGMMLQGRHRRRRGDSPRPGLLPPCPRNHLRSRHRPLWPRTRGRRHGVDELTKRGEINRIGGPAYLHELIQTVPTAANAGYYAEIVAERAVLRRLVNAGTKIVQLGYGQDGEVEDLVNQAQAEVYAVAERRTAEDYVVLKDVMESTVDEIEASGHRGEGMVGVPTGFYELDELTHGLHPGQMIVIAARRRG